MIPAAVCFGFSLALGYLAVEWLLDSPAITPRWAGVLAISSLGAGAGIAFGSLLFSLALVTGAGSPWVVAGVEAAGIGGLLYSRMRRPARAFSRPSQEWSNTGWMWIAAIALAATLLIAGSGVIALALAKPHGDWDAWAIWNLRGKFLAGPGSSWRHAISPLLSHTHPDYPLLLSAWMGWLWKAAGEFVPALPIATALMFTAAAVGAVAGAAAVLRGTQCALLAGLVLVSAPGFLLQSVAQYADIPTGFYYLAAVVCLLIAGREGELAKRRLFAAGLFSGFAAWTKNEGIPFVLVLLICWVVFGSPGAAWRKRVAGALPVLWGAVGPLAVLALFKALSPAAEPMLQQGIGALAQKIADPSRYGLILRALWLHAWNWGTGWSHPFLLLAIAAVAFGWRVREREGPAMTAAAAALLATLIAYCGAYLIAPQDLAWRLDTSLLRLYAHLWPGALLLFFLALDGSVPETAPARDSGRKDAAHKKSASRR